MRFCTIHGLVQGRDEWLQYDPTNSHRKHIGNRVQIQHPLFERHTTTPCKKQGPAMEQMSKIPGPTRWETPAVTTTILIFG